ncbi:MAG: CCA tRNA nucleotidyltransferase [Acidobacteriaceae bacterium]|jgi:poly(A) polymerase|nr:CCA tRNA nucleotidyltransferase [Acidobacteriaceae bacterium]
MQEGAEIIRVLRAAGHQAWLVGGCVRDLLLGVPPQDFDVATSARPEQIAGLFPAARPVGAHFGVMLVGEVEVATFRSDGVYADGRRPESVNYETKPDADARRRDFTINGLFLDPFSGEVLDFVGGREDLARRTVRAIGDAAVRFGEDHLRMLRAVRFAARLDFSIDPATLAAIDPAAIRRIAVERVFAELNRILGEGGAARGMALLDRCGLLAELLPEVKAMQGVEQPADWHPEGDVWVHTLELLRHMGAAGPGLAWGALLHDVGKPVTQTVTDRIRFNGHDRVGAEMAGRILGRLRAGGELIERVEYLVSCHMRFPDLPKMRPATLKRFLRHEGFGELLELHRLDCLASSGRLGTYEYARAQWEGLSPEELRPAPLVTGRDVMALGVAPGPRIGELLRALEEEQLEGNVSTREEALGWLSRQAGGRAST